MQNQTRSTEKRGDNNQSILKSKSKLGINDASLESSNIDDLDED